MTCDFVTYIGRDKIIFLLELFVQNQTYLICFMVKISSILYYMYLSIYSLVYFIIQGITIPCPHFFKNPKWLNNNPEPNYFNLESSRCTFQIIAEPRLFPRIFVVGSKDELVSSCQNVFLVDLWFAECLKQIKV